MLLLECAAYALTPRAIAASQAWIFTACRVLSGGGFATLNSNVTPLLARMFGMRDLHVAIAVASWFEPVSGFGAMVAWAMHIRHDEAGGETTESCERPALLLLILLSTRSCLSACTRELACQCHNAALLLSEALC